MGRTEALLEELVNVEVELQDVQGTHSITAMFEGLHGDLKWCFTGVYWPHLNWERTYFWVELADIGGLWTDHWVVGGDFNMFDLSILLQCTLFIHLKAWSSMSSYPDQIKYLLDRQEKLHERQFELKALVESCESSSGPGSDNAAVPVDDWSRPFEWDSQANDIRFNVFGISKYRANQREVGPLHPVYIYFLLVVLCYKVLHAYNFL
ncbi:hypothetical protein H5410_042695 [Solanum commersonii]|uniref:Uncharacterized protein n=1 Tax=Solanum commersonii TaxID=4109 RepID=A0A9J5XWE7_SOLCO|nr:hypothetical protein H5410_042695 [Solanum commersonii]